MTALNDSGAVGDVGGHVSIFTVHKIVYSHAKKVGDLGGNFMRPAELFKSIVEHNKQKRLRRFMQSAEIDTRWGKTIDFCPV